MNLFLRADADGVRRDQRDVTSAMTHHPASGELRNQRGLADAGRTDQRDHTAAVHPTLTRRFDLAREQGQRQTIRFGQFETRRHLRDNFGRELLRQTELGQLLQQFSLDRRATRQIVPGERRQLRFQHAAQSAQLFVHIAVRVDQIEAIEIHIARRLGFDGVTLRLLRALMPAQADASARPARSYIH